MNSIKKKIQMVLTSFKNIDTCSGNLNLLLHICIQLGHLIKNLNFEKETKITKKKVIIIGGGPNRIGQGIEFDYCCVHSSFAIRNERRNR